MINNFLLTDNLYHASFGEQYTSDQIQKILNINKSWQYIGYCFIPIVIIIRTLYTSFCLYIGDLIQETHWGFRQLFNISLKADIVFGFGIIFNFYFYALTNNYSTIDDLNINCASLLKLVGKENIPNWLVLAYNSINFFELLYIILLVVFLKISFQLTYLKSIVFVLLTYFIGNYLYIVGMTFVYLNFS
ncbi:hypothetical protein FACS189423_01490 [Bacteroidia bacterium]|nr:hypothetical protein FACS189423_01490 [Bacteroidia bacterium]